MYDPKTVLNNMSAHDFLLYYIDVSYDRLKDLELLHQRLNGIVEGSEFTLINEVLFEDVCPWTTYFSSIDECHDYAHGVTKEGLLALISEFLINMKLSVENHEMQKEQNITGNLVYDEDIICQTCNNFWER